MPPAQRWLRGGRREAAVPSLFGRFAVLIATSCALCLGVPQLSRSWAGASVLHQGWRCTDTYCMTLPASINQSCLGDRTGVLEDWLGQGGGEGEAGGKLGGSWALGERHQKGRTREESQERLEVRGDDSSYVALCVVARDEHPHIREWVLHHYLLGVGRVYLFDDRSDPPLRGAVEDLILAGLVRYEFEDQQYERKQARLYDSCLQRWGARHQFLGFIDVDEFIMVRDPPPAPTPLRDTLPTLLREYEQYGSVVLHQVFMGPSNHTRRPPGGVLPSYTRCAPAAHPEHTWVKSLVRPPGVMANYKVHSFMHRTGRYAVDTRRRPWYRSITHDVVHDRLAVYHYITRSREDFLQKFRRGRLSGSPPRGMDFFDYVDDMTSTCVCREGVVMALALRRRLGHMLAADGAPQ